MDERLQAFLFRNYNRHVRPSRKLGDVVEVSFVLTLLQLISVAEKSEEMVTSQYITLHWEDHRLSWDPMEFGGITRIRLPSELFWTPEIALGNSIDGDYEITPVNAIITYNGLVEWIPPAIYTSSCSIQVEYFPFDWQNCSLRFQSLTYSSREVLLVSAYSKVVVDEQAYTANGEWEVVHCPIKINWDSLNSDYQDITLYLVIQRKPLFYIINIIIPCVLISSLSVLVFYLPSGCSEKTNMSISVLLGLPVYLLLLAKRVPETSAGVPLIGAYLLFTMLSVTFSVIFSVIVLNVHHRSPATNTMRPWVRTVFIEILPTLLNMDSPILKRLSADHIAGKASVFSKKESKIEESENKGDAYHSDLHGQAKLQLPSTENYLENVRRDRKNAVVLPEFMQGQERQITRIHASPDFSCEFVNVATANSCGTNLSRPKDTNKEIAYDISASASDDQQLHQVQSKPNERRKYFPDRGSTFGAASASKKRRCRFTIGRNHSRNASEGEIQPLQMKTTNSSLIRCANPGADLIPPVSVWTPTTSRSGRVEEYCDIACDENVSSNGKNYNVGQSPSNMSPKSDPYFNMMLTVKSSRLSRRSALSNTTATMTSSTSVIPNQKPVMMPQPKPRNVHMSSPASHFETEGIVPPKVRKRRTRIVRDLPLDGVTEHVRQALAVVSPLPRPPLSNPSAPRLRSPVCKVEMRDVTTNTAEDADDLPVKRIIHTLPDGTNHCVDAVNFISHHIKQENEFKQRVREWHVVAMVLDRLMFWIFFMLYITGSLYFAVRALTNYAPDYPFSGEYDPKYAFCMDREKKSW